MGTILKIIAVLRKTVVCCSPVHLQLPWAPLNIPRGTLFPGLLASQRHRFCEKQNNAKRKSKRCCFSFSFRCVSQPNEKRMAPTTAMPLTFLLTQLRWSGCLTSQGPPWREAHSNHGKCPAETNRDKFLDKIAHFWAHVLGLNVLKFLFSCGALTRKLKNNVFCIFLATAILTYFLINSPKVGNFFQFEL